MGRLLVCAYARSLEFCMLRVTVLPATLSIVAVVRHHFLADFRSSAAIQLVLVCLGTKILLHVACCRVEALVGSCYCYTGTHSHSRFGDLFSQCRVRRTRVGRNPCPIRIPIHQYIAYWSGTRIPPEQNTTRYDILVYVHVGSYMNMSELQVGSYCL